MPRRIASMITSKMLHKLSIVSMHGHPLSRLTARLRVGDNYNTDGEKCKYRAKIPQAPTLDGSGGLWYNDNKGGFLVAIGGGQPNIMLRLKIAASLLH